MDLKRPVYILNNQKYRPKKETEKKKEKNVDKTYRLVHLHHPILERHSSPERVAPRQKRIITVGNPPVCCRLYRHNKTLEVRGRAVKTKNSYTRGRKALRATKHYRAERGARGGGKGRGKGEGGGEHLC